MQIIAYAYCNIGEKILHVTPYIELQPYLCARIGFMLLKLSIAWLNGAY